jgi:hypothetical protein
VDSGVAAGNVADIDFAAGQYHFWKVPARKLFTALAQKFFLPDGTTLVTMQPSFEITAGRFLL